MKKMLRGIVISLFCTALSASAAPAVVTTVTNVLRNVSLQLNVYEQGTTNATGTKVSDKVVALSTKSLIQAIGAATSQNFGTTAKLVLSTVYSNVTVFSTLSSTNVPFVASNQFLKVGGIFVTTDPMTISDGVLTQDSFSGSIQDNTIVVLQGGTNFFSTTFLTNAGDVTTITPVGDPDVTNFAVATQIGTSGTGITNVSSAVDILYGANNTLYPVTNYIVFSTNSSEIVLQNGVGLNTTAPLTVSNLISQTGYSIQNLQIGYVGATNLSLSLEGFVRDALKVDVLSAHPTNRVVEDIFGATANWTAIGSGYIGGVFTNDPTGAVSVPFLGGYLSNAAPVVVQGTVTISFLKNLAQ